MPAIYHHHHTIHSDEIDGQGHANNLVYLRWMQDAAVAHSAAQGWPGERYQEVGGGWVVRRHEIEYRQPAFAGEEIVVQTWVADFRKIRSLRKYRIRRAADNGLLAVAETDWTFVALPGGQPRRLPPELLEAFEVVADPPDA